MNDEKERFDVNDLYTPLHVVREEVQRRWNDKELKKKVEDFLGGNVPEVFRNEPKAVLFRFIATPNIEAQHFFEFSDLVGLNPVYIEFLNDKFCTRNQDKVHLAKMTFFRGQNKIGDNIFSVKKIIDMEKYDNKHFSEIETLGKEKFVDFHHDIFQYCKKDVEIFDISEFKINEDNILGVYTKFFATFICHGVIFENYIVKDHCYEKKFTNEVVFPAFKKIFDYFGVKPLIVPLLSMAEEESAFWMNYPEDIENYVNNKIKLNG